MSTFGSPLIEATPDERTVQLMLWFPLCVERTVVPHLEAAGHRWERLEDRPGFRVYLADRHVDAAVRALCDCVTDEEAGATKALRLVGDATPTLDDLARVTTLRQLYLLAQSRWLATMIHGERLTSHFQPIVEADDPSKVFAYEALLRGRDDAGMPVAPMALLRAAREASMVDTLEGEAQAAALRGFIEHALDATVFINVNPASVGGADSTLASTRALIDVFEIPHENIVFEIVEMEAIADVEGFVDRVRALQSEGFRIALDDLGSGYSGLNLVHQLRPDFIKLDMALVRGVHLDPYKAVITGMVLELARRLDIRTIAEGVEEPGELAWLRANGVDFVQGYLIAKPASPPPAPSIELRIPRRV